MSSSSNSQKQDSIVSNSKNHAANFLCVSYELNAIDAINDDISTSTSTCASASACNSHTDNYTNSRFKSTGNVFADIMNESKKEIENSHAPIVVSSSLINSLKKSDVICCVSPSSQTCKFSTGIQEPINIENDIIATSRLSSSSLSSLSTSLNNNKTDLLSYTASSLPNSHLYKNTICMNNSSSQSNLAAARSNNVLSDSSAVFNESISTEKSLSFVTETTSNCEPKKQVYKRDDENNTNENESDDDDNLNNESSKSSMQRFHKNNCCGTLSSNSNSSESSMKSSNEVTKTKQRKKASKSISSSITQSQQQHQLNSNSKRSNSSRSLRTSAKLQALSSDEDDNNQKHQKKALFKLNKRPPIRSTRTNSVDNEPVSRQHKQQSIHHQMSINAATTTLFYIENNSENTTDSPTATASGPTFSFSASSLSHGPSSTTTIIQQSSNTINSSLSSLNSASQDQNALVSLRSSGGMIIEERRVNNRFIIKKTYPQPASTDLSQQKSAETSQLAPVAAQNNNNQNENNENNIDNNTSKNINDDAKEDLSKIDSSEKFISETEQMTPNAGGQKASHKFKRLQDSMWPSSSSNTLNKDDANISNNNSANKLALNNNNNNTNANLIHESKSDKDFGGIDKATEIASVNNAIESSTLHRNGVISSPNAKELVQAHNNQVPHHNQANEASQLDSAQKTAKNEANRSKFIVTPVVSNLTVNKEVDSHSNDASERRNDADDELQDERPIDNTPDKRFLKYNIEIGRGSFKTVYKGLDTESGVPIAWCELSYHRLNKQERQRFKIEAEMLKQLQHPNIVRFYGYYQDSQRPKNIILVTELMTSGTLKTYIQRFRRQDITKRLKVIKNFAHQILKGLMYLHGRDPPVIHRDLKCDNVFVTGQCGQVKIGDLGLATLKKETHAKSVIGTPEFMAPEMYDEKYDESVDIYAFGMCLLEMATGEYPYHECKRPYEIYKLVTEGIKPQCFKKVENKELKELIELCIHLKSERRPNVKELVNHSAFMETNGLSLEVLRDPKTERMVLKDENTMTFHIKIVDKNKRKVIWPDDELIEFDFNVDKDIPEEVVKELNAFELPEEDTRYLVQAIKDRCYAFKIEIEELKDEEAHNNNSNQMNNNSNSSLHKDTSDKSMNNDANRAQEIPKTLVPNTVQQSEQLPNINNTQQQTQVQMQMQQPQMTPNKADTQVTASIPLTSTIPTVIPITTPNTNMPIITNAPQTYIDPAIYMNNQMQKPFNDSVNISAENSTVTLDTSISALQMQQFNSNYNLNEANQVLNSQMQKPVAKEGEQVLVQNENSDLTKKDDVKKPVQPSATRPAEKKKKELKLTILDFFEDLTVSCALESDNKKLEFKFGLTVDTPQDIASKLSKKASLPKDLTTQITDFINDAIQFLNVNQHQAQIVKNKVFIMPYPDEKNKDLSEQSENEVIEMANNGLNSSLQSQNQGPATLVGPTSVAQLQQIPIATSTVQQPTTIIQPQQQQQPLITQTPNELVNQIIQQQQQQPHSCAPTTIDQFAAQNPVLNAINNSQPVSNIIVSNASIAQGAQAQGIVYGNQQIKEQVGFNSPPVNFAYPAFNQQYQQMPVNTVIAPVNQQQLQAPVEPIKKTSVPNITTNTDSSNSTLSFIPVSEHRESVISLNGLNLDFNKLANENQEPQQQQQQPNANYQQFNQTQLQQNIIYSNQLQNNINNNTTNTSEELRDNSSSVQVLPIVNSVASTATAAPVPVQVSVPLPTPANTPIENIQKNKPTIESLQKGIQLIFQSQQQNQMTNTPVLDTPTAAPSTLQPPVSYYQPLSQVSASSLDTQYSQQITPPNQLINGNANVAPITQQNFQNSLNGAPKIDDSQCEIKQLASQIVNNNNANGQYQANQQIELTALNLMQNQQAVDSLSTITQNHSNVTSIQNSQHLISSSKHTSSIDSNEMSILLASRRSSIELKEIGINTSPGYARLVSEDVIVKDELPSAYVSNQSQSASYDEVDSLQKSHHASQQSGNNNNNHNTSRDDKPKIVITSETYANDSKSIKEKQSSAKEISESKCSDMSKAFDTCSERSFKDESKKEKSESKPKDAKDESEAKPSETSQTNITFNLTQILALSRDEKLIEIQIRHRKEVDDLLKKQQVEIHEYMLSKLIRQESSK